jgi:hypothetical protein
MYIGSKKVTLDHIGRYEYIQTNVNGHEAVWLKTQFGIYDSYLGDVNAFDLMWIQDGIFITLSSFDDDFESVITPGMEELMRIAGSLRPFGVDGGLNNDSFKLGTLLSSLEEAQDILGAPLFVPTYLENGEVPALTWKVNSSPSTIGNHYYVGYYDPIKNVMVSGERHYGSFHLYQTNAGYTDIPLDSTSNYTETTVNGHKAVWFDGRGFSEHNGSLQWIQNGIHVRLNPIDLDFEYVMKIAESLRPLE